MTIDGISATGTYYYRLSATSTGSGCTTPVYSASATLQVVADPSLSAATRTNSVICAGGSSVFSSTLSNGTGTVGYQWQYSADNTNWSTVVAGTPTGATYTNPTTTSMTIGGITATGTYYYRLSATSTGNGCTTPVYSASATLQVVAAPTVGTQPSTPATICVGGTSANMTVAGSGGTGTFSYQWQYNNGGTWGNVSNGTPAGSTYTGGSTATFSVAGISTAGTYQYRCMISQSGSGCATLSSNTVNVTVVADPSLSAATRTNSVICAGGSSVFSSTLSNGTGTVGYQWQYSADNTTWSNVVAGTPAGATYTNQTTTSMTIGGISATGTYYYRLSATSTGSGCTTPVYSASATLQVVADPTITTQPTGATICYGGTHAMSVVTANGTGSYTYQWQSSPDGTTWTNISGATSASYTTLSLTTTTYYRVITGASGNGCGNVTSNSATVTVYAPLTPGTISSDQTICSGAIPAQLTGSSPTGGVGNYTYQWQQQANCTGAWTNISGATSANYSPPALTQNTCYRRMVTDNLCGIAYSMTVTPTTGLVLEYTFDDPQEPSRNFVNNPNGSTISNGTPGNYQPGWDVALHADAITVSNWSSGYNSGVPSAAIGYHARWIYGGADGGADPCMYFQDQNDVYGLGHRWLGISQSLGTPASLGLNVGDVLTVSWYQKSSVAGKGANVGLYHYRIAEASYGFETNITTIYVTNSSVWERVSFTTTIGANWDLTQAFSIYVYGYSGAYGQLWVDKVQIEKKDHATPFITGTINTATVTDYSGNGNHGTIDAATSPVWTSSGVSGGAYDFNGSQYIDCNYGSGLNPSTSPHTFTMWVKPDNAANNMMYMTAGQVPNSNYRFYVGTYNGKWDMGIQSTTWGGGTISASTNWTHIAVVMNGSVATLYVNGIVGRTINYTSYTFNKDIYIANHDNNYWWLGYVDDVRIYNTALTPAQIQEITNSSSLMITVNPIPTVTPVASPAAVCIGTQASLSASSPVTGAAFAWNPGSMSGSPVTVTPMATTTYTVTSTAASCSATSTVTVTVIAPPSTGLSSGDYIWSGNTSIDWTTPSNWLIFGGGNSYSVAPSIPDNTKNVIIRAYAPCGSNISHVPTAVSGSCKNLTIETQLIMDGTSSLNVYGNWTNNGIFNAGNGTVTFTGAITPVTIITGGTGANYDFHNLTINKATGTDMVRIASNDLNVTNMLTMTKGNVDAQTNNKVLILGTATNNLGTIAYTDGFVYGKMRRWFSGTNSGNSTGLFPFGVGAYNRHLLLEYPTTAPATGGSLTAYFNEAEGMDWPWQWLATQPWVGPYGSCGGFLVSSLCEDGYWQTDAGNGLSGGTYSISLRGDGLVNPLSDLCMLTSVKSTTTNDGWDFGISGNRDLVSGTIVQPLVKRSGVTTGFSKWGLAGGGEPVPLPISLLSFNAVCENNVVDITWTTATEINNDYFTIQRSTDAVNWEFVKNIPGSGNSNTVLYYATTDDYPYSGTSYYRLKQTDFDGSSETFSPVAVICRESNEGQGISYYPNPFTSEVVVDMKYLDFDRAVLRIYDLLGKIVYEQDLESTEIIDQKLTLNLKSLPAGIYSAEFVSEGYSNTSKIIKNY